jgi:hypothetical protein
MAGKQQKMMMLTVEELEVMRDEAVENARKLARAEARSAPSDGVSVEEMLAMREQYEARLADEAQKREDLEFRVRLALAKLRDVESATDKLRAIQDSLKGVLGEVAGDDEEKTQPRGVPSRRVQPPAVPARALRTVKRALA